MSKISKFLENTNFVSRLKLDAFFENEKRRYNKESSILDQAKEYRNNLSKEEQDFLGDSLIYAIYPKKDVNNYIYQIDFISKFGANPNRELNDGVDEFLWVSNDIFLYSKKEKGIFMYNLNTGLISRIISGKGDFKILEYKDNILRYDDEEVELSF